MLEKTGVALASIVWGAAIGDALGVPFEFRARDTFECQGMVGFGTHEQPAGTWSDDTALLLATVDSVRRSGGIDADDLLLSFRRWFNEGAYTPDGKVFDYGNTTAEALRTGHGLSGEWNNGNGSLMRIAPLACFDISDDEVRAASAVTHAHPISMEACVEFVRLLRDAFDYPIVTREKLRATLSGTPRSAIGSSGYVLDTLLAAKWCLANTDSYRECVLAAVNLGDDTDTTACVAGALAGAVYGIDGIPNEWRNALRGREVIEAILQPATPENGVAGRDGSEIRKVTAGESEMEDAQRSTGDASEGQGVVGTRRTARSILALRFSRSSRRFLLRHGVKTVDRLRELDEGDLLTHGASAEIIEELRPFINQVQAVAQKATDVPTGGLDEGVEEGSSNGSVESDTSPWTPRFTHITLEDCLSRVGIEESGLADNPEGLRKLSDFLLSDEGAGVAVHSTNSAELASIARDVIIAYDDYLASDKELESRLSLPVGHLGFSQRVMTVAKREGLETIGDLCVIGMDVFSSYKGVGTGTVNNVLEVLGALDIRLVAYFEKGAASSSDCTRLGTGGLRRQSIDVGLHSLPFTTEGLSTRARHSLRIAGLDTVGAILEMGEEGLRGIRNAGAMTAAEIYAEASRQASGFLVAHRESSAASCVESFGGNCGAEEAAEERNVEAATKGEDIRSYLYELSKYAIVSPLIVDHFIEERHGDVIALRYAVEDSLILSILEANPWGLTSDEVLERVSRVDGYADAECIEASLERLQGKALACADDRLWNRSWLSLEDALANSIEDASCRSIVASRIEGKTLQEIGDGLGITRERVRQIAAKVYLSDVLKGTRAEKYLGIASQYDLNEREMRFGLGATKREWNALSLVIGGMRKGIKLLPSTTLLKDVDIPLRVRMSLEGEIYHGYVKVKGEYVRKARLPLMLRTLKTYGSESAITEDELLGHYRDLLDELGLSDDPDLSIADRYFSNLRLQRCVLSGYWKHLRYYEIDQYNLDELVAALGFEEFEDKEISTRYFTLNKADLLSDYDMHDPYELHSLLRTYADQAKSLGKHVPYEMTRRMPIIRIGHANRKDQVVELARELSPVRVEDFARAYEEKYGVEQPTVLANFVKYVSEYVVNGEITMGLVPFTDEESRRMAELLPGDYYALSQVERIYKKEFPEAGTDRMNSLSLSRMGFRIYSSYVLRSKWKTCEEYLEHLVFAGEFFDEDTLPQSVAKSRQYEFFRYSALRNRRMLPYDGCEFITRKGLLALGIADTALIEFAAQSASFCEERGISYCTTQSLKSAGFSHVLLEYEMSNDFYVTALCSEGTRFTSLRCSNGRIACLDDAKVSVAGLVDAFVDSGESIAIDDLMDRIRYSLGLTLRRDKITEAPLRTNLYYSSITDMIYKNRETFVEQVL